MGKVRPLNSVVIEPFPCLTFTGLYCSLRLHVDGMIGTSAATTSGAKCNNSNNNDSINNRWQGLDSLMEGVRLLETIGSGVVGSW